MKIQCDKCGTGFYFRPETIKSMSVKIPRRSGDLINQALDEFVVGHGYRSVRYVNCPCCNNEIILEENCKNESNNSF